MSQGGTDGLLPYSSIHLELGKEDAALTAICYGVRLHVQINSRDLLGTQSGAAECKLQLEHFLKTIDEEPQVMQEFEDWLLLPCIPHIRHLDPLECRTATLNLHDYFHPATLLFVLENVGGQLEARRLPEDPSKLSHLIPRVSACDPTVSAAVQQNIPCIPASKVVAIREPGLSDWEYNDIPKHVQILGVENQQLHFKVAFERGAFVRELDILLRTKNISEDAHITRLVGLVQWEDDQSIAGLLVEFIPEAKTLDWAVSSSTYNDRMRWMAELRHTVGRLHDAHIIWGDVKPENILINKEGHAWVVDFGGGYSLTWVGRDVQGTMEGDLQGLDAVAKYLDFGV